MILLRRLLVAASLTALLLSAFYALAGRSLLLRHISRATGRAETGVIACWNCHNFRDPLPYRRGLPHPDPWAMTVSPDQRRLYVACGPTRSLVVLDLESRRRVATLAVDGRPRGLALSPDGATLCISLSGSDRVAVFFTQPLRQGATLTVGQEPAGLCFDASGQRLFVANSASHDVSVIEMATGRELRRVAAGREPFAVAASPDGRAVAVVARMASIAAATAVPAAELTLLDARDGQVTARIPLPSCHMAEAAAFTADGRQLLIPAVRVRNLLPILQVARGWVMSSVLAVVDLASLELALLPLGDVGSNFPDPSGIALSRDGRRAFVVSGGADQVAVVDVAELLARRPAAAPSAPESLTLSRHYLERRFAVGGNPRDLALIGDGPGAVLAVSERLDDSVGLFDLQGAPVARIPVADPVREDAVRRGDRVFHDASYAFQGAFSCRSCHPGGHTDGLSYDFDIDGVGRNVVLNRSLRGVGATPPFKWNGKNESLQRQCGARFAMVLTRADPFPEDRLDDLVAYLESLPAPPPDRGAGSIAGRDSGAVVRGAALFRRDHRKDGALIEPDGRCVTCHPPPLYTNRLTADVGTQGPRDDLAAYDVPHLGGIGSKAPYLHDGRATTLEEIWTLPGVGDRHGVVSDFNKADLNDLVEYLKGL